VLYCSLSWDHSQQFASPVYPWFFALIGFEWLIMGLSVHLTVVALVCLWIALCFNGSCLTCIFGQEREDNQCPTSQISMCSTRTFEHFNTTLENEASVLSSMVSRTWFQILKLLNWTVHWNVILGNHKWFFSTKNLEPLFLKVNVIIVCSNRMSYYYYFSKQLDCWFVHVGREKPSRFLECVVLILEFYLNLFN